MADPYNINDINQQSKNEIEQEIDEEAKKAEKIERDNLQKSKLARKKLEKAEQKQKLTTDEMRRQNEKLENARQSAFRTYENAEEANRKVTELEKERSGFGMFASARAKVSNWAGEDAAARRDVEEMMNRTFEEGKEGTDTQSMSIKIDEKEEVKGEGKTNEELKRILKAAKNINKETEIQSKEGKKEETRLKDILKTTKYAEDPAKKATEKLEKDVLN